MFYHTDHLGSSVGVTDAAGTMVSAMVYGAWGEEAYSSGAEDVRYRFTGQEMDDTEIYYYGSRYYDPELGRFLQADTMLDGLNRYTYCGNNPVKYIDPSGHRVVIDDDEHGNPVYESTKQMKERQREERNKRKERQSKRIE